MMNVSVREIYKGFMFFIVFMVLLLIVASGYQWLKGKIDPFHSHSKPMGDAVKVFQQDTVTVEQWTIPDRLLWFFTYGE